MMEETLAESIKKISEAATAGKEASKAMLATMGRKKTHEEKTIGLPDAVAISVSIILSTMHEFITQ